MASSRRPPVPDDYRPAGPNNLPETSPEADAREQEDDDAHPRERHGLGPEHREADALEKYKQLLKESPDYPGKPNIENKLAALTAKPAENNSGKTNTFDKP